MSLTELLPDILELQETERQPANEDSRPWRWTLESYHRATDLGFFGEDEAVELLRGQVYIHMSPQRRRHSYSIRAVEEAVGRAFPAETEIQSQLPITAADDSEPEPDVAVLRGAYTDYPDTHPPASDVLLLVEVADSSATADTEVKSGVYAESGIQDYWILLVRTRALAVYRDPGMLPDGSIGYRNIHVYTEAERVSPLSAPEAHIRVSNLLPPRPVKEPGQ